ncbi:hypothetical protein I6A84_19685 [Frankia sp. CNm7]|uniref:Uncharacterized protein n=1 Tax=Frankia nepalensis TaxID=1836974 RepID=A0A937URE0_9ACTN|nr:hypothetical protein [Frankia nepalensis]MBL7496289.1 hypothetical protein [Frankia nepalensis]MBL7508514.1 hypothetical protein [Frankia nepalensis]MBL7520247.1 hypothetical protein [Frankia nepalensis]MBL7627646.1 hypothetical protein [Frankia nepalensis]
MPEPRTARTYNQNHAPRTYTPGRRRVSIYVSWSYPAEAGRNPAELDNRFSTMTEIRRVAWPAYEEPRWSDPFQFQQGIAGALELFFWAWVPFQTYVEQVTGHPVPVYQRIDQAGFRTVLDERVLADTDTLFVFGLDNTITGQKAELAEIEALRHFLRREDACLILGPHHDIGASDDLAVRDIEYHHHGDLLVPRQQRLAGYVRGLMQGLGVPVENRYGLRPAVRERNQPAPLALARDLDPKGWLDGVSHFNFHQHLPHYAVTTDEPGVVQVLARQPIDLARPHPFIGAGGTEFNTFLWMPPAGDRAGDVLLADSTIFSSLFGGDESLRNFWRNLVSR